MFFFFFSSRRRHTRFYRDWSSDVCSSDLEGPVLAPEVADPEAVPVRVELGVLLRDGVRGKGELEPGLPAHPEREGVDGHPPELPASLHEALQEPAKIGTPRGRRWVGHDPTQR